MRYMWWAYCVWDGIQLHRCNKHIVVWIQVDKSNKHIAVWTYFFCFICSLQMVHQVWDGGNIRWCVRLVHIWWADLMLTTFRSYIELKQHRFFFLWAQPCLWKVVFLKKCQTVYFFVQIDIANPWNYIQ